MVHVQHNPAKKWLPILGALTVAALAASWWARDHAVNTNGAATSAQAPAAAIATGAAPAELPAVQASPEQQQQAQQVLVEQTTAAQELDKMAEWRPLKGPVTERPRFASIMEWEMLKGVAERQPNAQAELTRLTNFLRYNKLLEKWQDLPANADAQQRQALAAQLSSELPQRVRNGEVDHADALRQLPAMLRDAHANGAQRDQAASRMRTELDQAQAAYNQANQANAPVAQP
jgi:hypothetical protein